MNIGPCLASNIKPGEYLKNTFTTSFFISPIRRDEVITVIRKLRDSNAGIDGLNAHVFKEIAETIIEPPLYILNLSFEQDLFPSQLKAAIVVPLYKGGDSQLLKNKRPVSILPVMSKVLGKLMYHRLTDFLTQKNILYEYQFGFRKNYSTEIALSVLVDKIESTLDKGESVIGNIRKY